VISGADFDHLLEICYSGSLHHHGQYREGMAQNPWQAVHHRKRLHLNFWFFGKTDEIFLKAEFEVSTWYLTGVRNRPPVGQK
jgi:hypothetical protein